MRIERLLMSNVGPFEAATLEFPEPEKADDGELVLFEGPNGSGKTTLAETIAILVGPTSGQTKGYDSEALTSDFFSRFIPRFRKQAAFEASITHDGEVLVSAGHYGNPWIRRAGSEEIAGRILQFNDPRATKLKWAAFVLHAHMPSPKLAAGGPREITEDPRMSALSFDKRYWAADAMGQLAINLEFERVQYAQYAAERPAESDRLHAASDGRKRALQGFEKAFSKLLDRQVTFVFEPGRLSPRMLFDGEELPLDMLGEGMRSTVAWLSDLLIRIERIRWVDDTRSPWEQEFWLILDEIEASLHPTMQMRILPALRDLFPRARIYATTHSPFVVASVGEGHIVCLRPDPKTHRVSGTIRPVKLEPGQSLEWVIDAIFDAPTGIVDAETRSAIQAHQREVDSIRRGTDINWDSFLRRRDWLVALNLEVAAIVRMTEAPVRGTVEARLGERAA